MDCSQSSWVLAIKWLTSKITPFWSGLWQNLEWISWLMKVEGPHKATRTLLAPPSPKALILVSPWSCFPRVVQGSFFLPKSIRGFYIHPFFLWSWTSDEGVAKQWRFPWLSCRPVSGPCPCQGAVPCLGEALLWLFINILSWKLCGKQRPFKALFILPSVFYRTRWGSVHIGPVQPLSTGLQTAARLLVDEAKEALKWQRLFRNPLLPLPPLFYVSWRRNEGPWWHWIVIL